MRPETRINVNELQEILNKHFKRNFIIEGVEVGSAGKKAKKRKVGLGGELNLIVSY